MPRSTIPAPNLNLLPPRSPLLELKLRVVTPMFGGSAVVGEVDPLLPVRGNSIRGQLRFWWRACNAHRYAHAQNLFDAEAALWGQTHREGVGYTPSRVEIEVFVDHCGSSTKCVKWEWKQRRDGRYGWSPDWQGFPAYALFPFQGEPPKENIKPEEWEVPPCLGQTNTVFRIEIYQDRQSPPLTDHQRNEVEQAVRMWILFGGVGARTRRGCGTLWCEEAWRDPGASSIRNSFRATTDPPEQEAGTGLLQVGGIWIPILSASLATRSLPTPILPGSTIYVGPRAEIFGAWSAAIRVLSEFRQVPIGRRQGKVPGRSHWPEPDSIRMQWPGLDPAHDPVHPAKGTYPRADLGLPIIFQRMGDPAPRLEAGTKDRNQPQGATRMASPIILKALPISETHAVPIALLLNAPHVWESGLPGVKLIRGGDVVDIDPSRLQPQPRSLNPDPNGLMAPARTVREAFLAYVESQWGNAKGVL